MTSPAPLKVTPGGLHELAQRCSAVAGAVSPTLPAVSASGWQSTGAAASTVNASMSSTGTACKSRMTANAGKLTAAAGAHHNQDDHGAQRLTAVASQLPSGSGGDGGAGGLPPGLTPLAPRSAGGDGGAAGLGTGR
jgi:hypothetical protein